MQQVQPGSPQLHVVAPPSAANPAGAPQAVPLLEAGGWVGGGTHSCPTLALIGGRGGGDLGGGY